MIEAIPVEQGAKEIKELDMTKHLLPIERALGVQWFVELDELKAVNMQARACFKLPYIVVKETIANI